MMLSTEPHISPIKCVKNEIHNILTVLRLAATSSSSKNLSGSELGTEKNIIKLFQDLYETLTYSNNYFLDIPHIQPFLTVIRSADMNGPITTVALNSIGKFISSNLFRMDYAATPNVINTMVHAILRCRFVSTNPSADEVVLLKLISVTAEIITSPVGIFLSNDLICLFYRRFFQFTRKTRCSYLFSSMTENIVQSTTSKIFGNIGQRATILSQLKYTPEDKCYDTTCLMTILKFFCWMCEYTSNASPFIWGSAKHDEEHPIQALSKGEEEDLILEIRSTGVSLLNNAIEHCGRYYESQVEFISFIKSHIFPVYYNIIKSNSLYIITTALRGLLTLFNYYKRNLRYELEFFICNIYIKMIDESLQNNNQDMAEALLSLLYEVCNDTLLMKAIYHNFDLEINEKNLYEHLLQFLCRRSSPLKWESLLHLEQRQLALSSLAPTTSSFPLPANSPLQSALEYHAEEDFLKSHQAALSCLMILIDRFSSRLSYHTINGALHSSPISLNDAQDAKKKHKKLHMLCGKIFSEDPKNFIPSLQTLQVLPPEATPKDIALFIINNNYIDLGVAGEYLTKDTPFHQSVLSEYMHSFSLRDMSLVDALKVTLSHFKLPGESQQIERIVYQFSIGYFSSQRIVPGEGPRPLTRDGPEREDLRTPRYVRTSPKRLEARSKREEKKALSEQRVSGEHLEGDKRKQVAQSSQESQEKVQESPGKKAEESKLGESGEKKSEDMEKPIEDIDNFFACFDCDVIYVLSYSIIMLNTDLHNSHVRKKMSVDEFVNNNRGINQNENIPRKNLEQIYNDIKRNPIRLNDLNDDEIAWTRILRSANLLNDNKHIFISDNDSSPLSPLTSSSHLSPLFPLASPHDSIDSIDKETWQTIRESPLLSSLFVALNTTNQPSLLQKITQCIHNYVHIAAFFGDTLHVDQAVRALAHCVKYSFDFRTQVTLPTLCRLFVHFSTCLGEEGWRCVHEILLVLYAQGFLSPSFAFFDDFRDHRNTTLPSNFSLCSPPLRTILFKISEAKPSSRLFNSISSFLFAPPPTSGGTEEGEEKQASPPVSLPWRGIDIVPKGMALSVSFGNATTTSGTSTLLAEKAEEKIMLFDSLQENRREQQPAVRTDDLLKQQILSFVKAFRFDDLFLERVKTLHGPSLRCLAQALASSCHSEVALETTMKPWESNPFLSFGSLLQTPAVDLETVRVLARPLLSLEVLTSLTCSHQPLSASLEPYIHKEAVEATLHFMYSCEGEVDTCEEKDAGEEKMEIGRRNKEQSSILWDTMLQTLCGLLQAMKQSDSQDKGKNYPNTHLSLGMLNEALTERSIVSTLRVCTRLTNIQTRSSPPIEEAPSELSNSLGENSGNEEKERLRDDGVSRRRRECSVGDSEKRGDLALLNLQSLSVCQVLLKEIISLPSSIFMSHMERITSGLLCILKDLEPTLQLETAQWNALLSQSKDCSPKHPSPSSELLHTILLGLIRSIILLTNTSLPSIDSSLASPLLSTTSSQTARTIPSSRVSHVCHSIHQAIQILSPHLHLIILFHNNGVPLINLIVSLSLLDNHLLTEQQNDPTPTDQVLIPLIQNIFQLINDLTVHQDLYQHLPSSQLSIKTFDQDGKEIGRKVMKEPLWLCLIRTICYLLQVHDRFVRYEIYSRFSIFLGTFFRVFEKEKQSIATLFVVLFAVLLENKSYYPLPSIEDIAVLLKKRGMKEMRLNANTSFLTRTVLEYLLELSTISNGDALIFFVRALAMIVMRTRQEEYCEAYQESIKNLLLVAVTLQQTQSSPQLQQFIDNAYKILDEYIPDIKQSIIALLPPNPSVDAKGDSGTPIPGHSPSSH